MQGTTRPATSCAQLGTPWACKSGCVQYMCSVSCRCSVTGIMGQVMHGDAGCAYAALKAASETHLRHAVDGFVQRQQHLARVVHLACGRADSHVSYWQAVQLPGCAFASLHHVGSPRAFLPSVGWDTAPHIENDSQTTRGVTHRLQTLGRSSPPQPAPRADLHPTQRVRCQLNSLHNPELAFASRLVRTCITAPHRSYDYCQAYRPEGSAARRRRTNASAPQAAESVAGDAPALPPSAATIACIAAWAAASCMVAVAGMWTPCTGLHSKVQAQRGRAKRCLRAALELDQPARSTRAGEEVQQAPIVPPASRSHSAKAALAIHTTQAQYPG